MLLANGFRVADVCGDYDGSALARPSARVVIRGVLTVRSGFSSRRVPAVHEQDSASHVRSGVRGEKHDRADQFVEPGTST